MKVNENTAASASEEKLSLEQQFAAIEAIITEMESGKLSLDRSFELYKEGLNAVKAANGLLDGMEEAMLVINEAGGLEEFQ